MKLVYSVAFIVSALEVAHAFSSTAFIIRSAQTSKFSQGVTFKQNRPAAAASSTCLRADFSSDFASAMPSKPVLSVEEKMRQSADTFIETMTNSLGQGVEAPPELVALREARESDASTQDLAMRIYELMIERGMRYDEEADTGTLTPTEFDVKSNLDIKEVKDEFAYLYKYGMMLVEQGLLDVDQVKSAVQERLIARTGLAPEEFDAWLGY
jgi:hypothetical protein